MTDDKVRAIRGDEPSSDASVSAFPAASRERGSVQILCEEIGFPFTPDLERPEVLVRFVGELIAEVDLHANITSQIAKALGKAPGPKPEDEVMARSIEMIAAPDNVSRIALSLAVHGLCHELNPEDAYPTNHTIDMLSSCASAIRFGLETERLGISSRHAAEAASHVWRQVYGLRRLDQHTSAWSKSWAVHKLEIATGRLAAGQSLTSKSEDGSSQQKDDAIQAERDKLSGEVHQVRGELNEIGGKWVAEEQARRHLEAKLTALVEALADGSIREESVGNPDPAYRQASVIVSWYGEGALARKNTLSDVLRSLSAPPTTPTSAPVEDVGGLVDDQGRMRPEMRGQTIMLRVEIAYPGSRVSDLVIGGAGLQLSNKAILAALSPSLIQPAPVCVMCGAVNADPRPWDPREPVCPDCQDGRGPRPIPPQGEPVMREELEPCPFCGSRDIDPEGWMAGAPGVLRTGPACTGCGASAEDTAAWNTRAKPPRGDVGADSGLAAADDNRPDIPRDEEGRDAYQIIADGNRQAMLRRAGVKDRSREPLLGPPSDMLVSRILLEALPDVDPKQADQLAVKINDALPADDNHKALVEAAMAAKAALGRLARQADSVRGLVAYDNLAGALIPFQSRQEEK